MQRLLTVCALAILGLLSACAGGAAPASRVVEAPRPDQATLEQLRAGLPRLSELRGASVLTDNTIEAGDRLSNSAGFMLEGPPGFELGRLDASDGGPFEWAVYGFTPPAGPLVEVVLNLVDGESIDPAYVAVSNYSSGRWDLTGPHSFNDTSLAVTLPLDNAVHLSPADPPTAYFALIAPVGSNIALQGITVRTEENNVPTADLQANINLGIAPLLVDFNAAGSNDPDGSIVLYEFDFEDDGIFDVTDAQPTTQHSFETPGDFTVRLRVTDDDGVTAEATVEIAVNAQPTAALSLLPSGNIKVDELFTMDASASADSDGSIVLYEWDSDGNADYEQSGTDSTLAGLSFDTPGTYNLGVRVTDDAGATASATALLRVYNWDAGTADDAGITGQYTSLAVINGNPAISYHDADNGDLRFVRAQDATGSSWAAPVTVDSAGVTGRFTSLAVVNGNPAISYYDVDNADLRFVRANDADGISWGSPLTPDSTNNTGQYTSLAIINGNPAIAFYYPSFGDLRYVRASDASGTAWGTAVTVDGNGNTGLYASLSVVNSNPAIGYYNSGNGDLHFARATDSDGASWATPVTVDSDGTTGQYCSLEVVNGNPALSYFDASNLDLRFVRAADGSGMTWGTPFTVDSNGDTGWYTSLAVINGQPAISYFDLGSAIVRYVRATDSDGAAWSASDIVDDSSTTGHYSSLALVDGRPAVSYFDIDNGDLRFAIGP
ncbi:PKD domain-containing protein [bacterium]|nr:PKD domain-containing protein [bacterium]